MKLNAFHRKCAMRNSGSAERNMAGLTRPTIHPIVAGMPRMARSSLPTPRNEKALLHVEATMGRMDTKILRSLK